jgi:hypothetical protein
MENLSQKPFLEKIETSLSIGLLLQSGEQPGIEFGMTNFYLVGEAAVMLKSEGGIPEGRTPYS